MATSKRGYTISEFEELRRTRVFLVKKEEQKAEEKETQEENVKEEEGFTDVCEKEEKHGLTQIYLAVERNDTRLLMSLEYVNVLDSNKLYTTVKGLLGLNKNESVDPSNAIKNTSLRTAFKNDVYIYIAETLMHNHGTDDVMISVREQLFHLAAKNGDAEVLDALLGRGICDFAELSNDDTPLHVAVKERRTNVVEVILKHSCRFSGRLMTDERTIGTNNANLFGRRGNTHGGHVFAEIVWARKSTPLETMLSSAGSTALELAVESIQPKMVKILLSVDRCVYSETHIRNSFCCMIKSISPPNLRYEVMSTMKHSKVIDRPIREVLCYDIQHKMKCNNIKEIAHLLMNSSKFNINHQDDEMDTLIHDVIRHCGSCFCNDLNKRSGWRHLHIRTIDHVVQLLLKKGADFNLKNSVGETPLIAASEKGCCHIIETLFDWEQKSGMKLDLDERDHTGATALITAVERNHVSVVRLLLNHKVSINLHDYYGFTALHLAVYEPSKNWFERHFDSKEFLVHDEISTQFKEEIVELLLAHDETNVNAIDFIGNTPLDLAMKSSKRINSETFEALKHRGAIQKLTESKDEASIHVARVDERDRLTISHSSNCEAKDMKRAKIEQEHSLDLGVREIPLEKEKFRKSDIATDDKGRTPLHNAAMSSIFDMEVDCENIVRELLEIGNNVNASDMYGKTPLHYAGMNYLYELLVKCGADECIMDINGDTPRDLKELRKSLNIKMTNASELLIKKEKLYTSRVISTILDSDDVIALSKRSPAQTLRIYSETPRQKKLSEETIWQVWVQKDFLGINRRLNQLRPSIQRFIERLADGVKELDPRFECKPILVGSTDEETKAFMSADFDYSFKLIKFSRLCDAAPHPLGPKGYFQLRRARDNRAGSLGDDEFACFFNLHQCLLTNEVNSKFQIILQDVLHDPHFWQDEHLFEWKLTFTDGCKSVSSFKLYRSVQLIMIHPIADGEGSFLFDKVSIDVVACVHAIDLWLGDQLSVAINPAVKADCCALVFDQPRYDLTKQRCARSVFSDTFARLSFATLESRFIRESSPLIKAAYMVCKLILYDLRKTTYQLKNSVLFCIEALKVRNGCERKGEDQVTPKKLAFWVERIMFCFMEFSRHDVYPCYFMPSFRQRVAHLYKRDIYNQFLVQRDACMGGNSLECKYPFDYSVAFATYLDLGPDDIAIDIPIFQKKYKLDLSNGELDANLDPKWEQFDREELIRQLSSRSSSQ